jgi:hypothetical protein
MVMKEIEILDQDPTTTSRAAHAVAHQHVPERNHKSPYPQTWEHAPTTRDKYPARVYTAANSDDEYTVYRKRYEKLIH